MKIFYGPARGRACSMGECLYCATEFEQRYHMPLSGKNNTVQLAIALEATSHELAIALLSLEGIVSFQEEDELLLAYLPEQGWDPDREQAVRAILQRLPGEPPAMEVSFITDRNWNAEWEAHLKPVEISDRFLIAQKKGEAPRKPGQIVLTINPKMSFGTGYHETTRLMLRQLEEMDIRNERIIDIGTGTGVLAIAARKLGNTQPILAFDNSSWAAENAAENIVENEVSDIRVELLDAEEDLKNNLQQGYTLILANINKNVIDRILPVIAQSAPEASVLLSGILAWDEAWLKKLLKRLKYEAVRTIYEEEWLSALVRRSSP